MTFVLDVLELSAAPLTTLKVVLAGRLFLEISVAPTVETLSAATQVAAYDADAINKNVNTDKIIFFIKPPLILFDFIIKFNFRK